MRARVENGDGQTNGTSSAPEHARRFHRTAPELPRGRRVKPQRMTRWACVAGIITALPTPYLVTFAFFCLAVGTIAALDLRRMFALHGAWSADAWTALAMVGSQLAALAGLLYLAATGLSRFLLWAFAHKAVTILVAALIAGLMLGDGFDFWILRGVEAAPPEQALQKLSLLFAQ